MKNQDTIDRRIIRKCERRIERNSQRLRSQAMIGVTCERQKLVRMIENDKGRIERARNRIEFRADVTVGQLFIKHVVIPELEDDLADLQKQIEQLKDLINA